MGTEAWRATPATLAHELSGGTWTPYPHLRLLALHVAQVVAGRIPRLMVITPPRHGKSELISKWTPVWALHLRPHMRIMLATHTAEFAHEWGGGVRDLMREHRAELYGVQLKDDSQAKGAWRTTAGGGMWTTGVGGPMTGRGAELLLIDDPTKDAEEARSPAIQRRHRRWWTATARTRLQPNAGVIFVNTRWDPNDLSGWLLATQPGRWVVLRLPAIADGLDYTGTGPAADLLGREPGEALCSELYDEAVLLDTRAEVGEVVWAALYQGLPVPEAGAGLWTEWQVDRALEAYGRLYGADPLRPDELTRIVVGVDPPGGRTEAGIVVAGRTSRGGERQAVVLEDASVGGRPRPEVWASAAVEAYHRWQADAIVAESNYGGDMVRSTILAADPSVPVKLVNASRGKRVRAEPVQALYPNPLRPDAPVRVLHAGTFPLLRRELTTWIPDEGMESPNRLDALVWAMTELRVAQRTVRRAENPLG